MSDIFHDSIKEDKQGVIDSLENFCSILNIQMPEVNTNMRLDVLIEKSNEVRKKFWGEEGEQNFYGKR